MLASHRLSLSKFLKTKAGKSWSLYKLLLNAPHWYLSGNIDLKVGRAANCFFFGVGACVCAPRACARAGVGGGGVVGWRSIPKCTGHLQLWWFSQAEVRVLKIPATKHTCSEARSEKKKIHPYWCHYCIIIIQKSTSAKKARTPSTSISKNEWRLGSTKSCIIQEINNWETPRDT